MCGKLLTILILCSFAIPVFASEWPSDSFDYATKSKLIPRGKSFLTLSAQQRTLENRHTETGSIKKLGKFRSKNSVHSQSTNQDPSEANYQLKLTQIRVIPTWMYGLTSNWTIGALLPFTQTQAEKSSSNTSSDMQVGNVEIMSKENLWTDYRSRIALEERVRFPSEEADSEDYTTGLPQEPSGYATSLGAIYEYEAKSWLGLSLEGMHEINFHDNVKDINDKGDAVYHSRNPGDKTTLSAEANFFTTRETLIGLGFSQSYKTADQYDSQDEIAEKPVSTSQQSLLVLAMGYQSIPESKLDQSFGTKFKFYKQLAGVNIEAADIYSLQFQMIY
jgi:hypothetical protein